MSKVHLETLKSLFKVKSGNSKDSNSKVSKTVIEHHLESCEFKEEQKKTILKLVLHDKKAFTKEEFIIAMYYIDWCDRKREKFESLPKEPDRDVKEVVAKL